MKKKTRSDIIKEKLGIERTKGYCTWCQEPVEPPKRTWCSQECVEEYRLATDWTYIRNQVFKRDKGICALCGKSTQKPNKTARQLLYRCNYKFEVDHIIPFSVCQSHNLVNLRTLCPACHKQITIAQAKERLKKKRKNAPLSKSKRR